MIIITGLGRCGTSFMMQVFIELGFKAGKTLQFEVDLKAGLELAPAYAISRDMFTDYLKKNEKINLYEEHFDQYWGRKISLRDKICSLDDIEGGVEIFKDPRITWHPDIIRNWWEVRKDLQLIILHRKPDEIIKSRERAGFNRSGSIDTFQDPKRGKRLIEFYNDFREFYDEVLFLGIPHVFFTYPDFTSYPKAEILNELHKNGIASNIDFREFIHAWEKVFDESKMSIFEEMN